MNEPFVDDRLDKDMVEVRKLMKTLGTNPVFRVEFRRTEANNIVMFIESTNSTAPNIVAPVSSLEKIGELFSGYVEDTANWT